MYVTMNVRRVTCDKDSTAVKGCCQNLLGVSNVTTLQLQLLQAVYQMSHTWMYVTMSMSTVVHKHVGQNWYIILMIYSTKVLCPQNLILRKSQLQRLYVPLCGHTTFVLLTPACTMTVIDKVAIFSQRCKQNKHFRRITGNKYSTLHVLRSNIGLGIKSMAGLKTFMEEWNGHNGLADPLTVDEQLQ